jgi:hypothetical protein
MPPPQPPRASTAVSENVIQRKKKKKLPKDKKFGGEKEVTYPLSQQVHQIVVLKMAVEHFCEVIPVANYDIFKRAATDQPPSPDQRKSVRVCWFSVNGRVETGRRRLGYEMLTVSLETVQALPPAVPSPPLSFAAGLLPALLLLGRVVGQDFFGALFGAPEGRWVHEPT